MDQLVEIIDNYYLIDCLFEETYKCEYNINKKNKYTKHSSFYNVINGLKIINPKYSGCPKNITKKKIKKYNDKEKKLNIMRQRFDKYNFEIETDIISHPSECNSIKYGYCHKINVTKIYDCWICCSHNAQHSNDCVAIGEYVERIIDRYDIEKFVFMNKKRNKFNANIYAKLDNNMLFSNVHSDIKIKVTSLPKKINLNSATVKCILERSQNNIKSSLKSFDMWLYDKSIFWEICNYVDIVDAFNFAKTCVDIWNIFDGYLLYREQNNISMSIQNYYYSLKFLKNDYSSYFIIDYRNEKVYEYVIYEEYY